ncbi:apolipoprotein N-acyltransferase [Rhodobacter ferrooxidans]
MAAGQAPLGAWYVTVPALAGVIWLVGRADGAKAAAWLGLFAGAGHFGLALNWIIEPFLVDPEQYGWMAPFAVVLMAFGLGLFWAAAAALARAFAAGRAAALPLALTLTAVEGLRGVVLTGFPWALIGHIWIDTPLAQLAAYGGPNGLTLLTTLAAALPVALGFGGAAVSVALLAATFGLGQWRLSQPDPAPRGVTLRLVQPNAAQALKWEPGPARITFDRLLAYTAARPAVDLVIWPETSVPYLLHPGEGAALAIAAAAQGVPVAAGVQRVDGTRGYNTLAVIGPGGAVTAQYDKHHLVPFGEYIPYGDAMADWFGLRAFAAQEGNGYSAGPGAKLLDLGDKLGKALPLICYEAVFPQDLAAAEGRADWILQITNDAWFGTLTGPFQHLAQARLRAIEQGLPLVRVANTGVSAVIDAHGRTVAEISLGQAAFHDAALPGALPPTPYARWGEVPVWLLLAGLAAGLIGVRRRMVA